MMKRIFLLVGLFLSVALGSFAQSVYGDAVKADVKMKYVYSFEEALKRAREENKPIFFNCFADWAIPCHVMNKYVFSDGQFAEWMDNHFVNFFIDVSTAEGKPFADKYDIKAQAHYIVLDKNGDVILRIVGGHQLPEFQELLALSLNPETTLPAMDRKYAEGNREETFLRDYAKMMYMSGNTEKGDTVSDEYFSVADKSAWSSAETWELYERKAFSMNSDKFRFLVENRDEFVKNNGREKVDRAIGGAYWRELYPYTGGKETYDKGKLLDLYIDIQKSGLPDSSDVYAMYYIVKYRGENNVGKLLEVLETQTAGWEERMLVGVDLGLTEMPDLSPADLEKIIDYLKKRMEGLKGSALQAYREAVKLAENPEGIKFENMSFDEALKKAKKEGKLVFMDGYTSWCGPCKVMSMNVFTQKQVGDFFNVHFVNLKVDMEKGEGVELCKRYEVTGFPTMFVLNPKGDVVVKIVGARNAANLLEEVKKAVTAEK